MNILRTLFLFVVLCLPTSLFAQSPELPIVTEEVDEIQILIRPQDERPIVVFILNDQILATRIHIDEMIWTISDGKFLLIWQDYWTAERFVTAKKYSIRNVKENPYEAGSAAWWAMQRNMRDLKQP